MDEAAARETRALGSLLLILNVAAVALKIFLVFRLNVNWDEFFYLAHVHSYDRGEVLPIMQTFHVHLFYWLTLLPHHEMGQLTAARLVMAALSIASAVLLYSILRLYFSRMAALATLFLYLAFSDVLDHGTSFRADPMCAFLFLGALYVYLTAEDRKWPHLLAGALMGLALMISIKSALFGIFWAVLLGADLMRRPTAAARQAGLIFAGFLIGFGVLYAYHDVTIAAAAQRAAAQNGAALGQGGGDTLGVLAVVGRKVISQAGFFPRFPSFLQSLLANPIAWLLVLAGGTLALVRLRGGRSANAEILALAGVAMLGTLLFYRNAFAYFYVFLMPAGLFAAAYAWEELFGHVRRVEEGSLNWARIAAWSFVLIVVGNAAVYLGKYWEDRRIAQSEIIALVHELFPKPVPYIDRNSMVSSFPKVGFFMSSWGIEGYRGRGLPIMRDILESREPKFLIANRRLLWLDHEQEEAEGLLRDYLLLDDDFRTLGENFIHHWGALYVAGKRLQPDDAGKAWFEILITGPYTLESESTVYLDGRRVEPGAVVRLTAGQYRLEAPLGSGEILLRYGDHLPKPDHAPAPQPIYAGL
jgi:4-amino-4-deoxy-L-arabinose transferase-like glycosyltransferase